MISSLIAFLYVMVSLVLWTDDRLERLMRTAALFCGALVVVGAQASNVTYSDFIVKSLSDNPTAGVSFLAVAVPAAAGAGVGAYFVHAMRQSVNMTLRVMAFIGMLATTAFAAVYVEALSHSGVDIGATAIPNIAFVVSILLYAILKVQPDQGPRRGGGQRAPMNLFDRISHAFGDGEASVAVAEPGQPQKTRLR